MTPDLDAIRDKVAELKGWKHLAPPHRRNRDAWTHHGKQETVWQHPFPATLDGAASALPEGWEWRRVNDQITPRTVGPVWYSHSGNQTVSVPDTGNEIHDRYLLALRAMEAR